MIKIDMDNNIVQYIPAEFIVPYIRIGNFTR